MTRPRMTEVTISPSGAISVRTVGWWQALLALVTIACWAYFMASLWAPLPLGTTAAAWGAGVSCGNAVGLLYLLHRKARP